MPEDKNPIGVIYSRGEEKSSENKQRLIIILMASWASKDMDRVIAL
jgi:hypothetical protein